MQHIVTINARIANNNTIYGYTRIIASIHNLNCNDHQSIAHYHLDKLKNSKYNNHILGLHTLNWTCMQKTTNYL